MTSQIEQLSTHSLSEVPVLTNNTVLLFFSLGERQLLS